MSSRSSPRAFNQLSYDKLHIPVGLFVNICWTDSTLLMLPIWQGDQTGEQYSSIGRTSQQSLVEL